MSISRRAFLASASLAVAAKPAPAKRVAVAPCRTYGSELEPTLAKMFDQIGGLARIVRNKTVAIKINLTGAPSYRLGHAPAELAHWTHPAVIGTTCHLMGRAGARRIRLLESPWNTADPLEQYMLEGGWEPSDLLGAAPRVEMENTNYLGNAKKYSRFLVPGGGHVFQGFDLNHSYQDCDVFVSIAKLKEHNTTGVTISMKNCFGITPCTIYGEGAPKDEPSLVPRGGRGPFHSGHRQPAASALPENDPSTPREGGYRVPRIVADLVAARPIDLAIVDGIESMSGGEGPWIRNRLARVSPGMLIVGTNPVNVDAVGTALMGFDPMADRGTAPFEKCDSTLRLAEEHGVGTRDLKRIEVVGGDLSRLKFDMRKAPAKA